MDFKEWASETITEEDSSKLMEAREPMEESPVVATAFRIKRKEESDPAEEIEDSSDEIEESGDEIEESGDENEEIDYAMRKRRYVEEVNAYYRSKWITPEWDVDSFDGLEYDSSEEETDEIEEGDEQDWRRFIRQHIENKRFYVDQELWPMYKYTNHRVVRDLERSAGLGQTCREYLRERACLCLQKYNQEKKSEDENFINVEFVEVVGAVSKFPKSYITFKAREKPDGPLVDYQAKVWSYFAEGKVYPDNYLEHYPILCRRALPPKPSN